MLLEACSVFSPCVSCWPCWRALCFSGGQDPRPTHAVLLGDPLALASPLLQLLPLFCLTLKIWEFSGLLCRLRVLWFRLAPVFSVLKAGPRAACCHAHPSLQCPLWLSLELPVAAPRSSPQPARSSSFPPLYRDEDVSLLVALLAPLIFFYHHLCTLPAYWLGNLPRLHAACKAQRGPDVLTSTALHMSVLPSSRPHVSCWWWPGRSCLSPCPHPTRRLSVPPAAHSQFLLTAQPPRDGLSQEAFRWCFPGTSVLTSLFILMPRINYLLLLFQHFFSTAFHFA